MIPPFKVASAMGVCALALIAGSSGYVRRDGIAKWYGQGTAERTYQIRINQGLAAPGWKGPLIEVIACEHIGEFGYFRLNGGPIQTGLIIDCSQTYDPDGGGPALSDANRHRRDHLWLEVDYWTAKASGTYRDGRANATVWYWCNDATDPLC